MIYNFGTDLINPKELKTPIFDDFTSQAYNQRDSFNIQPLINRLKEISQQYQQVQQQFIQPLVQEHSADFYLQLFQSYPGITAEFRQYDISKFFLIQYPQSIYFGELLNEVKHGFGLYISSTGSLYEGQFRNDMKHIKGTQIMANGNIYIGEFKNGKSSGEGIYCQIDKNYEIYQGEWDNAFKNGKGIFKSQSGEYYNGEWKNNLFHGIAIWIQNNGDIYKGEFKDGTKHGEGQEIFHNGDQYLGDFVAGKPHGTGIYLWKNKAFYQGHFQAGIRHGNGKWVLDQNNYYQGQYVQDLKQGQGMLVANGDIYQGEFSADKKHGKGSIVWKDGSKYNGDWKDGVIHGIGTMYLPDQNMNIEAEFQNNVMVKQIRISVVKQDLSEFKQMIDQAQRQSQTFDKLDADFQHDLNRWDGPSNPFDIVSRDDESKLGGTMKLRETAVLPTIQHRKSYSLHQQNQMQNSEYSKNDKNQINDRCFTFAIRSQQQQQQQQNQRKNNRETDSFTLPISQSQQKQTIMSLDHKIIQYMQKQHSCSKCGPQQQERAEQNRKKMQRSKPSQQGYMNHISLREYLIWEIKSKKMKFKEGDLVDNLEDIEKVRKILYPPVWHPCGKQQNTSIYKRKLL